MVVIRLRVELEEIPDRGWVAHVPEISATAQGETRDEALANLKGLLANYPEALDPLWAEAKIRGPQVELIPA